MHNRTEFLRFPAINKKLAMEIIFASELNQVTNSFKYRAASNLVKNILHNKISLQGSWQERFP